MKRFINICSRFAGPHVAVYRLNDLETSLRRVTVKTKRGER